MQPWETRPEATEHTKKPDSLDSDHTAANLLSARCSPAPSCQNLSTDRRSQFYRSRESCFVQTFGFCAGSLVAVKKMLQAEALLGESNHFRLLRHEPQIREFKAYKQGLL